MLKRVKDPFQIERHCKNLLGEPLSKNSCFKEVGSCMFDFKSMVQQEQDERIKECARCNFEWFEKGILLRINDQQKYYQLPLSQEQKVEIHLYEGVKRISLSILGKILSWIGVKTTLLEQFWIFRRGAIFERLQVKLVTEDCILKLDSDGRNYKSVLQFFSESSLKNNLSIHSKKYQ